MSSTLDGGQGTWWITNGVFIAIENPVGVGDTETGRVVRIDDHEWVIQEVGTTNLTSFHKR